MFVIYFDSKLSFRLTIVKALAGVSGLTNM